MSLGLWGCAGSPYYAQHQRAIAGTAMGTAGGALLGGAFTQDSDGALVGGLLGGAAGGLVGHSMDKANRPPPYPYYAQPAPGPYHPNGYQTYYEGGHRHPHRHRHQDWD